MKTSSSTKKHVNVTYSDMQRTERGQRPRDSDRKQEKEQMLQKQQSREKRDSIKQKHWIYVTIELIRELTYGFAFEHEKSPNRRDDSIIVTKIVRGGVAERDGRLRKGDIIVSVNDVNFNEVPHEEAIEVLRYCGPNMTLVVQRLEEMTETDSQMIKQRRESTEQETYPSDESEEESQFYQFQVVLKKEPNSVMGINIRGGYDENNEDEVESYISIAKLAPNGIAYRDGTLKVGDFILQVDSQPLQGLTHNEVVQVLRNTGKLVTIYAARLLSNINKEKAEVER